MHLHMNWKNDGQTKRDPCGGVMWILCHLVGGSKNTPIIVLASSKSTQLEGDFLEVSDLGLKGNQHDLKPLEDLLEVVHQCDQLVNALAQHRTRYDPILAGYHQICTITWHG